MPLFFFNIHNDDFTEDFEGLEHENIGDARDYAIRAARTLAAETVREGHLATGHKIEILDEDRQSVDCVTFADAVRIIDG